MTSRSKNYRETVRVKDHSNKEIVDIFKNDALVSSKFCLALVTGYVLSPRKGDVEFDVKN